MYVEEKDRSWCTSSPSNDHRAVTIEVANNGGAPDWPISDLAMNSLIKLVADICKRNKIAKLVWSTDKNTRVNHLNGANMTAHRDYKNKACPGDYIYNREGYIADEVNKILNQEGDVLANMTQAEFNAALDAKIKPLADKLANVNTTVYHDIDDIPSWG